MNDLVKMPVSDAHNDAQQSDISLSFNDWLNSVQVHCGRYFAAHPENFLGFIRPREIYGFSGVDLGCNLRRIDRTRRDASLDELDDYKILYQADGETTVIQGEWNAELAAGDIAVVDLSQPVSYVLHSEQARWLGLRLPRDQVNLHLGGETGAKRWNGYRSSPARLLGTLIGDAFADAEPRSSAVDMNMQLAVYDLLGALIAPANNSPPSAHTDKIFARVCRIVRERFTDPDFGPREAAAAAGISMRYLQKLFTVRGSTCREHIQCLRLEYAAKLIGRRTALNRRWPLGEIAYISGFREYNSFSRAFRRKFGCAPGRSKG